jgi:hypothetical protein
MDVVEKASPQGESLAPLPQGSNYRLLYTEAADPTGNESISAFKLFRMVLYNYTRQEAIVAEGSLGEPAGADAHEVKNWQPEVKDAEPSAADRLAQLRP